MRNAVFVSLLACTCLGSSAAPPALAQPAAVYDLLLKNGSVFDPSTGRMGRRDVAVSGERIVRIAPDLPAHHAKTSIDASAFYVTPGLVDLHAYVNGQAVFRQGDPRTHPRGVNPDHNALRHGVTTVVDGGSTGWRTFASFKELIADRSRVRVLAFLNIVGNGMADGETLATASDLEVEKAVDVAKAHRDIVVGIRSAHLKGAGRDALERSIQAAQAVGVPVLAEPLDEGGANAGAILQRLRAGDLVTHTYGAATPLFDARGEIDGALADARRRGVLFDLGHGSRGFLFRLAVPAAARGFLPDIISTGMDKTSLGLPRADMMTTLSKFLNLGVPLEHLLERATARPARAIARPDLGTLREGGIADVAVIELQRGRFGFLDSGHMRMGGDRRLRAVLTIRSGRVVWDSDGLASTEWSQAGPYSNYR